MTGPVTVERIGRACGAPAGRRSPFARRPSSPSGGPSTSASAPEASSTERHPTEVAITQSMCRSKRITRPATPVA